MDPVGFEPTISCLQSRRLPAWPRARTLISSADERTRTSTPLRAIDPKSIASANSATSASMPASCPAPIEQSSLASHLRLSEDASTVKRSCGRRVYPRFCHQSARKAASDRHHLSRAVSARRIVTCRVLSSFVRTAATRSYTIFADSAKPTRLALRCTLAQPVSSPKPLVGSYPTVSPLTVRLPEGGRAAGLLSVAVVVAYPVTAMRPHLRFRGATSRRRCVADIAGESREVPLPADCRQR